MERANCWQVELNGQIIGEFHNPIFEDMFWYSYEFNLLDVAYQTSVMYRNFWDNPAIRILHSQTKKEEQLFIINPPLVKLQETRFTIRGLPLL